MDRVPVWVSSEPGLESHLSKHPHVALQGECTDALIAFQEGSRRRTVGCAPQGLLVELADNNPLVCADHVDVLSPEGFLAALALGPVIRGGLALEPPAVLTSFDADPDLIEAALVPIGWTDGATCAADLLDLGSVVAALAMVRVPELDRPEDLDDLFEEAYGRSFFVRPSLEGNWDIKLVSGTVYAAYRLRYAPGLLTVQVMADRFGKAGAAQAIHAFNVMAGFEESLGLA